MSNSNLLRLKPTVQSKSCYHLNCFSCPFHIAFSITPLNYFCFLIFSFPRQLLTFKTPQSSVIFLAVFPTQNKVLMLYLAACGMQMPNSGWHWQSYKDSSLEVVPSEACTAVAEYHPLPRQDKLLQAVLLLLFITTGLPQHPWGNSNKHIK